MPGNKDSMPSFVIISILGTSVAMILLCFLYFRRPGQKRRGRSRSQQAGAKVNYNGFQLLNLDERNTFHDYESNEEEEDFEILNKGVDRYGLPTSGVRHATVKPYHDFDSSTDEEQDTLLNGRAVKTPGNGPLLPR